MIQKLLFFLSLAFCVFSSCSKIGDSQNKNRGKVTVCIPGDPYAYLNQYPIDSVRTTPLFKKYQAIWKDLFIKKNNLPDSLFDKHIQLMQSDTSTSKAGIFYNICYRIQSEWAIAYHCDRFIILITDTAKNALNKDLPRNEYLSEDHIEKTLDKKIYGASLLHFSNPSIIRYASMQDALQTLIRSANVNTLCMGSVYINDLGHFTLEASAQYANKNNACITASLDLATGITTTKDGPCRID